MTAIQKVTHKTPKAKMETTRIRSRTSSPQMQTILTEDRVGRIQLPRPSTITRDKTALCHLLVIQAAKMVQGIRRKAISKKVTKIAVSLRILLPLSQFVLRSKR